MKKIKGVMVLIIVIATIIMLQANSYASVEISETQDTFLLTEEILGTVDQEEITEEIESQAILEENEQTEINSGISLFSARAITQEIELGKIYSNYEPIFIENDKENVYYLTYSLTATSTETYSYFTIVKQKIATQEKETILGKGKSRDGVYQEEAYFPMSHYELGNIIYVECFIRDFYNSTSQYDKVQVFGMDTTTGKLVYEQEFAVSTNSADQYPSFAVDQQGHFYFVEDFTTIVVFNQDGSLCYDSNLTIQEPYEIILNSVSPDGKILFYSVNKYRKSGNRGIAFQGVQQLDNGKFVNQEGYTVTYANGQDPVWHFIDSQNQYAVNQYGQLAKIEYGESGFSIDILANASKYQFDSYYGYPKRYSLYFIQDNYIYVLGSENALYLFDMNNEFEFVGRIQNILDTDEETVEVEYITNVDGEISLFYSQSQSLYVKTIDLEDQEITAKQNIVYNVHSSQTHTKEEIEEKFKATTLFDYSTSLYQTQPSTSVPYQEGELKQGVITDTLNRLNFYRWLYGVNEVTLNTAKMARNQKGALLLSINNVLTHYPTQPEGMDDEFYQEAYDGCNIKYQEAEDTYSGNCAQNSAPPYAHIDDYVSDLYNATYYPGYTDAVGHRWSMLDLNAYATSFGYSSPYSTVSMYYNPTVTTEINEDFYAYPTAGYFPNQLFTTSEKWSIYFKDTVYFKEGYKLEFIYNGKSYEATEFGIEVNEPAITFEMPTELVNLLGGSGSKMPTGTITVKLSGVTNEALDDVTYQYDVNFFAMTSDLKKGDVNYDGKVNLYDALQILKQAILGGNLSDEMLYIMDYNDDEKVNLYDALKFLQQAILG